MKNVYNIRHTIDGHLRTFSTAKKAFAFITDSLHFTDVLTFEGAQMTYDNVADDMKDYSSSEVYVYNVEGYYVITRNRVW
jgi:hypothetical protein